MLKLGLSPAASALLRALVNRSEAERDRILLTEWQSTDWQSLTFVGERHHLTLRLCGPDASTTCARLTDGLAEAEFTLPGHLLADIAVIGSPADSPDGSLVVHLEALTIEE